MVVNGSFRLSPKFTIFFTFGFCEILGASNFADIELSKRRISGVLLRNPAPMSCPAKLICLRGVPAERHTETTSRIDNRLRTEPAAVVIQTLKDETLAASTPIEELSNIIPSRSAPAAMRGAVLA